MALDDDIQIRAIVKNLDRFVERTAAKLTLDITANLIQTTPVDTGWARANWVPSLTTFDTDPVGERSPDGVTTVPQSAGLAAATTFRLRHGRIHITNNVSYIGELNDGTSQQAPAGFVQGAVQAGVAALRGFRG